MSSLLKMSSQNHAALFGALDERNSPVFDVDYDGVQSDLQQSSYDRDGISAEVLMPEDEIHQAIAASSAEQAEKTKPKPNLLKQLTTVWRNHWFNEDSAIRRLITSAFLAAYGFAGGGIFYAIEGDRCFPSYWEAVYYVNTLITTIGFGMYRPCTTWGRAMTVVYTIFGIPLSVVAVSDLGFLMAKWTGKLWRKLQLCWSSERGRFRGKRDGKVEPELGNSKPRVVRDEMTERKLKRRNLLPVSLALAICIFWASLSSLYFFYWNRDPVPWTYFEAFYYFFISVSTIGLGDFETEDKRYTVLDFFFIIIGISLFSMCVNIVQFDLESISYRVVDSIMEDYSTAMHEGRAFGEIRMDDVYRRFPKHWSQRRREEAANRLVIRRLVERKGGILRFLIGQSLEDRMLEEYQRRAGMRLASTQTEIMVRNVAFTARPQMADHAVLVDQPYVSRRPVEELAVRERLAVGQHLKRVGGQDRRSKSVDVRASELPNVVEINKSTKVKSNEVKSRKPSSIPNSIDNGSVDSSKSSRSDDRTKSTISTIV